MKRKSEAAEIESLKCQIGISSLEASPRNGVEASWSQSVITFHPDLTNP